jgi:hypothetical protein
LGHCIVGDVAAALVGPHPVLLEADEGGSDDEIGAPALLLLEHDDAPPLLLLLAPLDSAALLPSSTTVLGSTASLAATAAACLSAAAEAALDCKERIGGLLGSSMLAWPPPRRRCTRPHDCCAAPGCRGELLALPVPGTPEVAECDHTEDKEEVGAEDEKSW